MAAFAIGIAVAVVVILGLQWWTMRDLP